MSLGVLPKFSSKSFIVSGLTFRSLIHFKFIFVYGVKKCSDFILLHVAVQFSQHHLLKGLIHIILHKNSKPLTPLKAASCSPIPVVTHDSGFKMESYLANAVV